MTDEVFQPMDGKKERQRKVTSAIESVKKSAGAMDLEHHNHKQRVRDFLKIIYMCPMDEEIKTIMRMNIWGMNPDKWYPMSIETISVLTKLSPGQVQAVIEAGKQNCATFLARTKEQEIYSRFASEGDKIKNHMFARQPYQRKRFSV